MLRDKGTKQEKTPHVETRIKSEAVLPVRIRLKKPGTRDISFGAIGQKCGKWLNLEECLELFQGQLFKG